MKKKTKPFASVVTKQAGSDCPFGFLQNAYLVVCGSGELEVNTGIFRKKTLALKQAGRINKAVTKFSGG